MRITALTIGLLIASHGGAIAEDFSGFYAGITAGYAHQPGERERQGPAHLTGGAGAPAADESRLPPSARTASEAMRARGRNPASPR